MMECIRTHRTALGLGNAPDSTQGQISYYNKILVKLTACPGVIALIINAPFNIPSQHTFKLWLVPQTLILGR